MSALDEMSGFFLGQKNVPFAAFFIVFFFYTDLIMYTTFVSIFVDLRLFMDLVSSSNNSFQGANLTSRFHIFYLQFRVCALFHTESTFYLVLTGVHLQP